MFCGVDDRRTWKRVAFLLIVVVSSVVPLVLQRQRDAGNGTPDPVTGPANPWAHITWEPYKVAIGAFYALCVQKIFDTAIEHFNQFPPRFVLTTFPVEADLGSGGELVLLQGAAILIWIGLYHLNNVRIYFTIPEAANIRRGATHVTLTIALGLFYFLASTVGRPSSSQLVIILGIVVVDAIFPLVIGDVLSLRMRTIWIIRGVLQSAFVIVVLVSASDQNLRATGWSAALFCLMLLQLFVLGPLGGHLQRRGELIRNSHQTPNG
jgi:hypothetical protein